MSNERGGLRRARRPVPRGRPAQRSHALPAVPLEGRGLELSDPDPGPPLHPLHFWMSELISRNSSGLMFLPLTRRYLSQYSRALALFPFSR